jgi:hypothetical protein
MGLFPSLVHREDLRAELGAGPTPNTAFVIQNNLATHHSTLYQQRLAGIILDSFRSNGGSVKPQLLDGGCDGDQQTKIGYCPQAMRFTDLGDQNVTGFRRERGTVFAQKLTLALDHHKAHLTLDIMGVHREFLASLEVEIQDLKVRGIVNQEALEGFFPKPVCLIKIDFLHQVFLSRWRQGKPVHR